MAGVGPTIGQGAVEALDLAVGPGRHGLDAQLYEVMTLVTCAGTRVAGGWLWQAVWGRW